MNGSPFAGGDEPSWQRGASPLFNLVYCSRAAASVDDAEVARIVATARRNNPGFGITGMLVIGSGIFFQWLEGPRSSIEGLLAQLKADDRHGDIVQLASVEEIRERVFPDWDMELVTPDHIRDVLQDALDDPQHAHQAPALQRLLAEVDAAGVG